MALYTFCLDTIARFFIVYLIFYVPTYWIQSQASVVRWSDWESCTASHIILQDGVITFQSSINSKPPQCIIPQIPPRPPETSAGNSSSNTTSIGFPSLVFFNNDSLWVTSTSSSRQTITSQVDPSGINITSAPGTAIRFDVLESSININMPSFIYVEYLTHIKTEGQATR